MLVCETLTIQDQVQRVFREIPIRFRSIAISDSATALDHAHRLTRLYEYQGLSGEYPSYIEKPLVSDHAKS